MAFNLPSDVSLDTLLEQVHPAVEAHTEGWQTGLDAYDGEGGFLDGGHLWQFQRENPADIAARKAQARYHNLCATLVDYYVRKICSEISRETTSEPLRAWWENVDGAGTDLTTYMRLSLAKALAAGHVGLLADKTPDLPTGPSVADERAEVFLTRFLPQAILDWRLAQDAEIVAVKLKEDIASDDLLVAPDDTGRVLLWDRDEWVRVSPPLTDGGPPVVEREAHTLGLVPLVVLRPFPSARWPLIGRALVEPSVLKALYNRASEQDVVLRDQAFSVMVVSLGPEGDVDTAKKLLGNEIGPTRALFVNGSASYETPSQEVPATLEANQDFLTHALYRMAHVPFDVGSREAQTAEAIGLQHEALQAVLRNIAAECVRVEEAVSKLFFAWTSATPEAAEAAYESAKVQITYPHDFFETDPEAEIKTLVAGMNAVPAPTFEKVIQKAIVSRVAPTLDEATRKLIDDEIDAGEAEPVDPREEAQMLRDDAEARLQAAANAPDEVAA